MDVTAALEEALNSERDPACLVDRAGILVFFNHEWDSRVVPADCVRATAAWLKGKSWLASISSETRLFYQLLFDAALALPAAAGVGLLHQSECNTPTLIRRSTCRFAPVYELGIAAGVLLLFGLEPLGTPQQVYGAEPRALGPLRDSRGALIQCSCCRRLLDPRSGHWLFVPSALEAPEPTTTQSVCASCGAVYMVAPTAVKSRSSS